MGGDQYFEYVQRNFDAFILHLEKNTIIRETNERKMNQSNLVRSKSRDKLTTLIKESQNEIQELSKPFRKLFEDAINDTKMEIFERNMKTQERTSKLIKSPKSAQKSTLNVDGTI